MFINCHLLPDILAVECCPRYTVHGPDVPGTQESMCPGLEDELVLTSMPRRKTERFNELSYVEKQ